MEFERDNFEEKSLELITSLEKAKATGNIEVIYTNLISLLKFSLSYGDFELVIDTYDDFKDYKFSEEMRSNLLQCKISSLLKMEDYNNLLITLKEKEALKLSDPSDRANTKFYESIAYEALDEIDKSIKALESIRDDIPRYSLINKYLKLALLYIKVNDITKAKESYEYASMVDFNHKNDIFLLVESDLYFASGNYIEALNSFESFFLKSPNKYKYLDRYIEIMIKLNNLTDAYNFYRKFITKDSIRLSSQNKYRFLLSVKKLLLMMDKEDELFLVNKELENAKPVYYLKAEEERDKIINEIMNYSLIPLTKYDKDKNIVFHFFKLLKELKLNELLYVKVNPESITIYEYLESRMREKTFTNEYIKENHLSDYLYGDKDNIPSFISYNGEVKKGPYKLLNLKDSYNDFGYVLINGEVDDLTINVLKNSIFQTLMRLNTLLLSSTNSEIVFESLDKLNRGFISFRGDKIYLYNLMAKKILREKNDVMSFDVFNNLSLSKNLFASSFSDDDIVTKEFYINDENVLIEFEPVRIDSTLYAFIKDVSKTNKKENSDKDYLKHSSLSFYNVNYLEESISKREESYSMIGLDIEIIEKEDSMDKRDTKLDGLYRYLNQVSPKSELYYLGENHFLILSSSTDKRVIESTFKNVKDGAPQLYKYTQSLREKNITGFASKSLKNKSFNDVKDIIEYGFRHSSNKEDLLFLDNEEKRDYALYKTYEGEIIRRLKDSDLNVEYIPIIDNDKKIRYLLSKFSLPFDIPYSSVEEIITKANLESKSDQVMIDKVFTEVMQYNSALRFIIPIHIEAIYNENFIKKTCILFKKSHIENRVIFSVENVDTIKYKKALMSLKNAGIKLATTFNNLKDLKDSTIFNIIFINFEGGDKMIDSISKGLNETLGVECVSFSDSSLTNTLTIPLNPRIFKKEDLIKL